ncbi:MAG: 50S ribosomal protein L15 [Candidatus Chisholmbacteria bacterium]|nr:50S ribosomal protein L15 [Candidatus Chisholmbacteria bacterium]
MRLTNLTAVTSRRKKRIGRGYGSGKGGHTVGRGAKGKKARGKVPAWFEGGQLPLIRRLPFQRGKSKFSTLKPKPVIVKLGALNLLPKNSQVTVETLVKYGLVKADEAKRWGVKILGDGELKVPLKILVPTSRAVAEKIKVVDRKTPRKKVVRSRKLA